MEFAEDSKAADILLAEDNKAADIEDSLEF